MSDCILCRTEEGVAVVTLNRPEALNALNQDLLGRIYEVMDELDRDGAVKAVVLTGSGEKAFAAGADIFAIQKMTPAQAKVFSEFGQRTMNRVASMRPVTIAAVNGFALGGGCELAMACDIRVAGERAKMGIPEVVLGVFPGFGGTQRLPRLVGLGCAKELLATGRQASAEECLRIGLMNHVVKPEELLPFCMELAKKIAANSTGAIDYGKQCMDAGMEMDLNHALQFEANLFGLAFSQPDQREGMTAFLEKRRPRFI